MIGMTTEDFGTLIYARDQNLRIKTFLVADTTTSGCCDLDPFV